MIWEKVGPIIHKSQLTIYGSLFPESTAVTGALCHFISPF